MDLRRSNGDAADPTRGVDLRFGSGKDALRSEDVPLVTGQGRFTDDIAVPGQAHAAFVRTQVAHAHIRAVDTAAASRMPGVIAVITGRELEADGHWRHRAGRDLQWARWPADVHHPHARAGSRARALRRRGGCRRDRGDAAAGAGCGREGGGRLRASARRARCRPGHGRRCDAGVARSCRQYRARLGGGRRGSRRCRLCARRPCRARAAPRYPPCALRHGAARGHCQLRQ